MRKFILGLALCLVAIIGVGASSGSAFAANCNASPSAPYPLLHFMGGKTTFYCTTDVQSVKTTDHYFRGGYSDDYATSVKQWTPNGSGTDYVTFTLSNCPGGSGWGPWWWGHWVTYTIENANTHTWGNQATSPQSAGAYMTCWS